MDTSEATQLLTWLDEEHRRDKAMVAELQKSIEQHEGHLSNVTERMEKLEERLAQTNAELARMSRFEQALQKFKDEILLELRGSEERLREEVDNKEKLIREERQERAKGLTKLEARVEEAFQFGDQLQTQQAELQRVNKAISALKLQIDEALKEGKKPQEKLLVLAEGLDRCDKAIAKLLQELEKQKARYEGTTEKLKLLEGWAKRGTQQMAELLQEREEEKIRSEGIKEKLKVLEGWAERGTQQIVDLQTFGERLREEQAQSVEQLRAVDDRRSKQIAAWAKEMRSWRKEAEKLREQPALIEKWHRSAEKTLAALDELKTQLGRDREVLEHLQHAGEERQKQQLEEWRKENEMLWLRNDERWQQLSVDNAKRDTRVTQLWESQSEHLRRQVRELAKWIKEFEKRLVRSKK